MELLLMVGLLGLTVLIGFALVLMLISGIAGRIAGWIARKRPNRLKWQSRIKLGTMALLLGGVSYSGYTAVVPSDGYYLEQMAEASMRAAPASARVVQKSASYPNLGGDYCSYSKVELSRADFGALLAAMSADSRLRQTAVSADTKPGRVTALKTFSRTGGSETEHVSLQFLNDGKSIEVNICET